MTSDQIKVTIAIKALRKLDPLFSLLESCNECRTALRFGCDLESNDDQSSREFSDTLHLTPFLSLTDVANDAIKWEGSCEMIWIMSYAKFKRLMPSFYRGIKIHVFKSQDSDLTAQEHAGWTTIDFQTLEDDCSSNPDEYTLRQWLQVNGPIRGSEISILLKIEPVDKSSNKEVEELNEKFLIEEDCVSLSSSIKGLPIGNGTDMFLLTVKLNEGINLQNMISNSSLSAAQNEMWLSYAMFDVVIQTDKFSVNKPTFSPVVDMFRLQSSVEELITFFENNTTTLEVLICTNGAILGSVNCDMRQLFEKMNKNIISKNPIHGYYSVSNDGKLSTHVKDDVLKSDQPPVVSLTILLQELPKTNEPTILSPPKIKLLSMQKNSPILSSPGKNNNALSKQEQQSTVRSKVLLHGDSKDIEDHFFSSNKGVSCKSTEDVEENSQNNNTKIEQQNKTVANKLIADLEKSKREWEELKHQEEMKWQEIMKEKEMIALRVLHEQAMIKEKESADLIDAARSEQKKLEARLRKALLNVEDRERRLIVEEENRKVEYRTNLSEIQMQQKILKEETKHLVGLEKAKVATAMNRAVLAEKSASITEKRYKQLEEEFENVRVKHRRTPEAALQQEIISLKAQLGDSEVKMERERADKHQILFEKEQLQNKIQSLIRTLNREREKNVARERRERENFRLECMAREQRLVIDGDRSELQRIKDELKNLSQIGGNMHSNLHSLAPLSRTTDVTMPPKSPYNCRTPSQEGNRDRINYSGRNT